MRVPSREAARQADGGRVAAIRGDRALASKGPIIPCQPDGDSGSVCAISARLGQTVCLLSGIEYQIGEIEPPSCDPEPFKGFGKLTSAGVSSKGFPCLRPSAARKRIVAGKILGWSRRRHRTGVSL